jgi:hypothetical protein
VIQHQLSFLVVDTRLGFLSQQWFYVQMPGVRLSAPLALFSEAFLRGTLAAVLIILAPMSPESHVFQAPSTKRPNNQQLS